MVRIALAVLFAAVGGISVMRTAGYLLRENRVEQAHSLAPGDGRVTAMLAQSKAGPNATAADRSAADLLARTALQQEPMASIAAATLGLDAQIRGNVPGAQRLLGYAQTLSRRDLQTQIWAIEDAVARGDIPGALAHYDIALRTSPSAPELLYPILAAAIADPAVRSALIRTLANCPAWRGSFIDYVSGNGPTPSATVLLFLALQRNGMTIPDGAEATVVSSLVSHNMVEAAWRYYAASRPGTNRNHSRDSAFTADRASPSPFDWRTLDDGQISASIQPDREGGVVDLVAPASRSGPLLQQMQMLMPGAYRLEGVSEGIDQPEASRPYWVLQCTDGRELGRVVVPNAGDGRFQGRFDVPATCMTQMLTLFARSSDAVGGLSGRIRRARLFPVAEQ